MERPHIAVPTEALPYVRDYIKESVPKSQTRRFIVDCHNGLAYWNNEFNNIAVNGMPESDDDILEYLRRECYKIHKNKIYSCVELTGSDLTMTQLRSKNFTPEQEKELIRSMRLIFYNAMWEPLEAYNLMI